MMVECYRQMIVKCLFPVEYVVCCVAHLSHKVEVGHKGFCSLMAMHFLLREQGSLFGTCQFPSPYNSGRNRTS